MGREHWLDVARFGESDGFEYDRLRPAAWPYRDYVIRALNADKPYAEFVRDQIAGDVRPDATADSIAATGFLVAGPFDEANSIQANLTMRARSREEELEDTVAAVSQTFLGLTVNCARCHDHKFDPIKQEDYYRIASAFAGVKHGERDAVGAEEAKARDASMVRMRKRCDRVQAKVRAISKGPQLIEASEAGDAPHLRLLARPGPRPAVDVQRGAGGRQGWPAKGRLVGGATISDGVLEALRVDGRISWPVPCPKPCEAEDPRSVGAGR